MQGGQKLALPSWMTARRPYFMSDCEKAFKCLGTKMRETTSWDQFLDLGCGAGELTRCIVKEFGGRHRVVVATERSPDVVKVLRRNAAQRDILYEVLDVEGNVDEALSSWGPFRRIFSLYHLESVQDKQRALNNIRRLLWDEGGELFLMFRVHSNLKPLYKMLAEEGRWTDVAAPGDDAVYNSASSCHSDKAQPLARVCTRLRVKCASQRPLRRGGRVGTPRGASGQAKSELFAYVTTRTAAPTNQRPRYL
ncbi:hypothetical protein HPB52_006029 [Rhipicephalus sanguineus]|uniref:Methyltransferase domain-containing protein n=1 Tax=Rhipicephalus sanguineus TaxID=34632 RepID=A0A9D4PYH5_RHISA|nr:hypothetical protein HPB52_006029 [Rhipicephalus sanguineus]